ncbi:ribonuclease J [Deferribacter autotrophicus]|uniref:Ribonuclease J n=1 Tax=Deferribacter autotrophicus TaxID=500465 RepID=A0A5A8F3R2_9BACT|nr:ribonuclease J [Deferribacter autotrophicus]KAA0257124.1 ribonuclease J [Deferribacter autotrophicus]
MSSRIIFLGGAGEIGMNMYLYESDNSAIIVDCGVKFADSSYPGIDMIIPDWGYIDKIKDKLCGIILTHGHEDHIGGLSYFLKEYELPIYGGELTLRLVEHKLKERKIKVKDTVVHDGDIYNFGDFKVEFVGVTHSIQDTFGLYIENEDFKALHISDYKMDQAPVNGKPFDVHRFMEIGKRGITVLLSDSTNIINDGITPSESSVFNDLLDVFLQAKGRVFFTTFSSNIDRIKQVIEICQQIGRRVVVDGTSVIKSVKIGRELGLLNFSNELMVSLTEANKIDDDKICYIISGCQGEVNSTLYKIAANERKSLKAKEGDLFIISARVIPGNELNLNNTINKLYYYGAKVVDIEEKKIHVSGHASKEEAKLLLNFIRPKYLIPIHGEFRHMKTHIELLEEVHYDIQTEGIFVEDGDVIIFEDEKLFGKGKIEVGRRYIDGRGDFILSEEDLKIKKHLSRDGIVLVQEINGDFNFEIIGFKLERRDIIMLYNFLVDNLIDMDIPREELVEKIVKRFFKRRFDKRPIVKYLI